VDLLDGRKLRLLPGTGTVTETEDVLECQFSCGPFRRAGGSPA
jgi:hypothetical protein